jgi:transketolase
MKPTVLSNHIRNSVFDMIAASGGGHGGGSSSMAEILGVLYGSMMKFDPIFPEDPTRDRFILSKGHSGMGLYAALAHSGFFPVENLLDFSQFGSPLMNHPDSHRILGVEVSTGSLGHGLSIAVGKAYAGRMKQERWSTWSIVGDAECHEGQIWEAAMFAAQHRLDNLFCIVDNNGIGNDDYLENTVSIAPIQSKWESFGWVCETVDGHDCEAIEQALVRLKTHRGQPSCLIANTIKGKGLRSAGTPKAHYVGREDLVDK